MVSLYYKVKFLFHFKVNVKGMFLLYSNGSLVKFNYRFPFCSKVKTEGSFFSNVKFRGKFFFCCMIKVKGKYSLTIRLNLLIRLCFTAKVNFK
jgi:hypothetical protein